MKRYTLIPAVLLFVLVGCEREEPEPETPPPPPPPSAQVLSGRVIGAAELNKPLPAPGTEIAAAAAQTWLGTLRAEKNKIANEPNGREAMRLVAQIISQRTRDVADLELWSFVMVMVEAHKVFEPGSDKLERLQEKAIRELSKPVVTLNILHGEEGTFVADVNMRLPLTGEVFKNIRMGVGDSERGVKFIKVLGRSSGIRIEYEDGGDQLDIMNKR